MTQLYNYKMSLKYKTSNKVCFLPCIVVAETNGNFIKKKNVMKKILYYI